MIARDITSLQHPIVKHLVKLRDDRRYRYHCHSALISGVKLLMEVSGQQLLKTVLITRGYPPPVPVRTEQTFYVTEEVMKKVTGLKQPEPLAAEIALPPSADVTGRHPLLILDQISDPGNLGTLLRTAGALGWKGVFLTPASADPFNDKALRAAQGATFRLAITQGSYAELFALLERGQLHLFVADPQGDTLDASSVHKPIALALGNEAHGPHSVLKARGKTLAIPMHPGSESFNVSAAGAILMFDLSRRAYG